MAARKQTPKPLPASISETREWGLVLDDGEETRLEARSDSGCKTVYIRVPYADSGWAYNLADARTLVRSLTQAIAACEGMPVYEESEEE